MYLTAFLSVGEVLEVVVPDDIPVDIRVKLMVCLIHQSVFKPLDVSTLLIYTLTYYYYYL